MYDRALPKKLRDKILRELKAKPAKSIKHGDHDQSDHGAWAHGGALDKYMTPKNEKEFAKAIEPLYDEVTRSWKPNEEWLAQGGLERVDIYSLAAYAGTGYIDINETLRNGLPDYTDDNKPKEMAGVAASLDRTLSKMSLPKDMVLHRGMSFDTKEELAFLKPGAVYTDPAYGSTSVDRTQAFAFANGFVSGGGEYQVIWDIDAPAGNKGFPMWMAWGNQQHNEGEILLPRNSHYRIDSVEFAKQNPDVVGQTVRVKATLLPDTPTKSLKHGDHDQSEHGNWATGGGFLAKNAEKFKAAGGTIDKPVKATDSPRADYAVAPGKYHWDDLVNKAVAANDARIKALNELEILPMESGYDIDSPKYDKELERFDKAYGEADRLALGYKLSMDAITSTPFNDVIVARGLDGGIVGALAYYIPSDESQLTVQLLGSTHEVSGTGTALMREAMAVALDKGIPFQVLEPVEDARPWYESLGLGPLQMSEGTVYHPSKPMYRVEPDALKEILGSPVKSLKHGDHDQLDHGSWATGGGFRKVSESEFETAYNRNSASTILPPSDGVRRALALYSAAKIDDDDGTPVHASINSALRQGRTLEQALGELEPEDKKVFKEFDKQFQPKDKGWREVPAVLIQETRLFRGMPALLYPDDVEALRSGQPFDFGFGNLKPGDVVADAGYGSTSTDARHAQYFGLKPVIPQDEQTEDSPEQIPVIWQITAPEGTPALSVNHNIDPADQVYGEEEIILGRDTHYEITKVTYNPAGSVLVEAKVIPTHGPAKP